QPIPLEAQPLCLGDCLAGPTHRLLRESPAGRQQGAAAPVVLLWVEVALSRLVPFVEQPFRRLPVPNPKCELAQMQPPPHEGRDLATLVTEGQKPLEDLGRALDLAAPHVTLAGHALGRVGEVTRSIGGGSPALAYVVELATAQSPCPGQRVEY